MRTPSLKRSPLRFPLDRLLGSPAFVRLLRTLIHEFSGPVSVVDAARFSGLSVVGARKALESLEKLGLASRVGTGRALKYGVRKDNPFLGNLLALFEHEQERFDELLQGLKQAVLIPEVKHAWIDERIVEQEWTLRLSAVVPAGSVSWIGQELRTRLAGIEQAYDLIVDLAIYTRADAPGVPDDATLLIAPADRGTPGRERGSNPDSTSEERSLRMARAVAELIRANPSIIRRTIRYVDRLLREGQGTADADIAEWRQLLKTYSPQRVRDLLTSGGSRAERLRRSMPFFAALTPDERDEMVKAMEKDLG